MPESIVGKLREAEGMTSQRPEAEFAEARGQIKRSSRDLFWGQGEPELGAELAEQHFKELKQQGRFREL